jgi:hypothetical protein
MSAGQPNWAKLAEMGKLPKDKLEKIPALQIIQAAEAKVAELEGDLKLALSIMDSEQKAKFYKTKKGIE